MRGILEDLAAETADGPKALGLPRKRELGGVYRHLGRILKCQGSASWVTVCTWESVGLHEGFVFGASFLRFSTLFCFSNGTLMKELFSSFLRASIEEFFSSCSLSHSLALTRYSICSTKASEMSQLNCNASFWTLSASDHVPACALGLFWESLSNL